MQKTQLDGFDFVINDSSFHRLGTDAEIGSAWVQQHTRTFAEGFARQVSLALLRLSLYPEFDAVHSYSSCYPNLNIQPSLKIDQIN